MVLFFILQSNLTGSGESLARSVLKVISVNGHVQHLVFEDRYLSCGRSTVRW